MYTIYTRMQLSRRTRTDQESETQVKNETQVKVTVKIKAQTEIAKISRELKVIKTVLKKFCRNKPHFVSKVLLMFAFGLLSS